MRIGQGFDVHPLVLNRKLILGGVEIPFEKGLSGHSDADVVIHAVCDALLGASGLGDLGHYFPDTDPQYKDIASCKLLKCVLSLVAKCRYQLVNVDVTVIAEKPKLAPYCAKIVQTLAGFLEVPTDSINIKAKTCEKLGFLGRGEGIAALAVVLLEERTTIAECARSSAE